MKEQSGRSLIEMLGVLALGGVIVAGAFSIYKTIDARQKHFIASETLRDIASKTQTLLKYSGYTPVSVDFLIKSGAIQNAKSPLGSHDWSITSSFDGTEFSINLNGLSFDECTYFATKKIDWTTHISVNGYDSGDASYCLKSGENKISFFAE
ncbi:MAG: prepilin-type N-terminal cleavage/methylation domain-containing protein [Alphaproteobacteria bacterium]|nr:prepilin-type N-terminal cleavage/methylation domain-containing protein [Alphaproteobacteria bacterium]